MWKWQLLMNGCCVLMLTVYVFSSVLIVLLQIVLDWNIWIICETEPCLEQNSCQLLNWSNSLKQIKCIRWSRSLEETITVQQSFTHTHTHTQDCYRCREWSRAPFHDSPWIWFHCWLNLFIRVERLFFFLSRRLCMMWLNPSACMGTGRPLISSCLMRDIDRPHLTQWTDRRWALPPPPATTHTPSPPPPSCTCWGWWD